MLLGGYSVNGAIHYFADLKHVLRTYSELQVFLTSGLIFVYYLLNLGYVHDVILLTFLLQ